MIPAINGGYNEKHNAFVFPKRYAIRGGFPRISAVFEQRMKKLGGLSGKP